MALYLTEDDVNELLTTETAVDVLEKAFLAQAESEPARGALTAARLRLELRNTTAPEAASKRREDRKPVLKGARRA